MESLALAAPSRLPLLAAARRRPPPPPLPAAPAAGAWRGARRPRLVTAAGAARGSMNVLEGLSTKGFATMSSSTNSEMSTGTGTMPSIPPPSSYIGSPVFWIGVGVALSAVFTTVSSMVKKYAMQQAFKSMMSEAPPTFDYNKSAFGPGSPFPFPVPPQAAPTASSSFPSSVPRKDTSTQGATVDVSATEVEADQASQVVDEAETTKASKKFAFVDVSPEELQQKEFQSSLESVEVKNESKESVSKEGTEHKIPTNGTAFTPSDGAPTEKTEFSKSSPMLSVETIEKMMEDPAVQKMVYPYLPEEMRNPESFKWMLQNPNKPLARRNAPPPRTRQSHHPHCRCLHPPFPPPLPLLREGEGRRQAGVLHVVQGQGPCQGPPRRRHRRLRRRLLRRGAGRPRGRVRAPHRPPSPDLRPRPRRRLRRPPALRLHRHLRLLLPCYANSYVDFTLDEWNAVLPEGLPAGMMKEFQQTRRCAVMVRESFLDLRDNFRRIVDPAITAKRKDV